uniref:TIMP-1 n=1 Tax=Sinohyriopsis cumingii TaxID=165450 RepID=A0A1Y0JYQ0_SINCU|nr:TIMP-1 [Sinohyriopsis cumingii]
MSIMGILVILLVVAVDYSSACSCLQSHKQEHFCSAEFVAKVHVKKEEIVYKKQEQVVKDEKTEKNTTKVDRYPILRKYHLKITKFFKGKEVEQLPNNSLTYVQTSYYDSTCGVQLKPRTKYLISGFSQDGVLQINTCSWVEPWNSLTVREKKGVQYLYKKNCDCKVVISHGPMLIESASDVGKTCSWNVWTDTDQCYDHHSLCVRDINTGDCRWSKDKYFKRCIKAQQNRWGMEP